MAVSQELNEKYYKRCIDAWIGNYADEISLAIWRDSGRITEEQYQEIINTPKYM